MNCQQVVELITDYMEGVLSAATADAVARHLDTCGECDSYLDQMRWTIDLLGQLPPEPPPPQVRAQLHSAFRAWTAAR